MKKSLCYNAFRLKSLIYLLRGDTMFEKLKYFIGTIGWFLLAVLLILGLAYLLFPDLIQNVLDTAF